MIDAPRSNLYIGNIENSNVFFLHKILEKSCMKYNLEYIDLTYPMNEDFKSKGIPFNSEINWHWNEYGNEFVANQLYKYLTDSDSLNIIN